jgi:hypothetical protein
MNEQEEPRGTVVELLLHEPEIVAWLADYRPQYERPDEAPDDDAPQAA